MDDEDIFSAMDDEGELPPMLDHDSLAIKRQFINRAFFPIGHLATKAIGIVPSSLDVASIEALQAKTEITTTAAVWSDLIMARVKWYKTAYESMLADNPQIPERELEEHIAAFGMSLLIDSLNARSSHDVE